MTTKNLEFGNMGLSRIKKAKEHLELVESYYKNKSCYFEQAHQGSRMLGGWFDSYSDIVELDDNTHIEEYSDIGEWLNIQGHDTPEEYLKVNDEPIFDTVELGEVSIFEYFDKFPNDIIYEMATHGDLLLTISKDEVWKFAFESQSDGRADTRNCLTYDELVEIINDMTSLDNMDEGIIKFVLENTPYIFTK